MTGTLIVRNEDGVYTSLHFLFGHLFHAQGHGKSGDEAVLDVLSWTSGDFEFDARANLPAVETVSRPLQSSLGADIPTDLSPNPSSGEVAAAAQSRSAQAQLDYAAIIAELQAVAEEMLGKRARKVNAIIGSADRSIAGIQKAIDDIPNVSLFFVDSSRLKELQHEMRARLGGHLAGGREAQVGELSLSAKQVGSWRDAEVIGWIALLLVGIVALVVAWWLGWRPDGSTGGP